MGQSSSSTNHRNRRNHRNRLKPNLGTDFHVVHPIELPPHRGQAARPNQTPDVVYIQKEYHICGVATINTLNLDNRIPKRRCLQSMGLIKQSQEETQETQETWVYILCDTNLPKSPRRFPDPDFIKSLDPLNPQISMKFIRERDLLRCINNQDHPMNSLDSMRSLLENEI